jgi:hypothetical protein
MGGAVLQGSQGGRILIQGEIGTQFVPEAAPLEGEKVGLKHIFASEGHWGTLSMS